MTTLADLDRTQRTIPSEVIREMTGARTGQIPHDHLWRDMRQCAGIALRQRKLTQLEAMRLIAVTVIWQVSRRLPTTLIQINQVASELLNSDVLDDLFTALQERMLSAAELRDAIARTTGKHPSQTTLYRWGQRYGTSYSERKLYTPMQVKQFIAIAQNSAVST